MEDAHLLFGQLEVFGELRFEKAEGIDPLREDHEAIIFLPGVPADAVFPGIQKREQALIFREIPRGDFLDEIVKGLQLADVSKGFGRLLFL